MGFKGECFVYPWFAELSGVSQNDDKWQQIGSIPIYYATLFLCILVFKIMI